ncbi:hypothetical protein ACV3SO_13790 [Clostridium perfringens]|nr:hypothetical protein [Clostridium perfringens]MDM0964129.1 hypothetical protein [Clostridium perfringens]
MKLTSKVTIRLNKNEENFLKQMSGEYEMNITDFIKNALNICYDTDIFILSQERRLRKWGVY